MKCHEWANLEGKCIGVKVKKNNSKGCKINLGNESSLSPIIIQQINPGKKEREQSTIVQVACDRQIYRFKFKS